MKTWLKVIVAIICIAAVAAAGFGIYSWIKADADKKVESEMCVDYDIEYFKDTQVSTQPMVFRAWAVGEDFTSIKYQIDTGAQTDVSVAVIDDADSDWEKYDESKHEGLTYVDTGIVTVDVSELEAGKHVFQIFVYNGDKFDCIMEKIFTIQ